MRACRGVEPELPALDAPGTTGVRRVRADLGADRRAWHRTVGVGIGALVISRVLVFAAVYARAAVDVSDRQSRAAMTPDVWGADRWSAPALAVPAGMREMIQSILLQWDGRWYQMIAADGYPRTLDPIISMSGNSATVAFFPVYPALAWAFDHIFPGGIDAALLGVNVVLSLLAVVLMGVLARDVYGADTAVPAMVLFSLFPGSAALSWSYAEASMIVFAAATFILLRRHRWVLAGLAAAVGTATRPNAIGLVAACAVAALVAIHRRRQWRSLVAVALAPLGAIGYHLFLTWWTGESGAWTRAQREGWNEGWSWGVSAVRLTWRFIESPLRTDLGANYLQTVAALVALAVGVYCSAKARLPLEMWAYVAVVSFLMVAPSTVSARPRFVFAAFPLVLGVAAWSRRHHRATFDSLVMLSAGSLVVFTVLYATHSAVP